jgi:hypothetical protein
VSPVDPVPWQTAHPGIILDGDGFERARAADDAGVPAVLVSGPPGTEMVRAAAVAAQTRWVRIAIMVDLDDEDPVTLAEEIAVVDSLSGGRVVVLTRGGTDHEQTMLRSALAGAVVRGVTISPPPLQPNLPVHEAAWAEGRFVAWDGDPAELVRLAAPPIVAELSRRFAPGSGA